MIKLEKKHIKIFSVVIAAVFVGSVVALALTQMGGLFGGVLQHRRRRFPSDYGTVLGCPGREHEDAAGRRGSKAGF